MSAQDPSMPMTPEQRSALARLRMEWGRMDGRTALVTGATGGIGLETARRLAGLGAEVLVHGRDPQRTAAALRLVRDAASAAPPRQYVADLGTLAGVRDLATAVLRDRSRLHVLVANAGVYAPERRETADGLELTFAVNVLAPIVLASQLLPALRAAAPARIVILSSASHWTGEIHWHDLQLAGPGAYTGLRAYDQSKLAVLMLTLTLARRLEGSGVSAVCLDPGDVATTMLASGWPELAGHPRGGRRRDQRVPRFGSGGGEPDRRLPGGRRGHRAARRRPRRRGPGAPLERRRGRRRPARAARSRGYTRCGTRTSASARPTRVEDHMSTPPVTIYSLTTCGWSRKAKEYFKQRGIKAFVIEYDTAGPELQQKISAEMRKEGADGFPFVRIAGKVVKGYDPAAYDRLLKAA